MTTKVKRLLAGLDSIGWRPGLTEATYSKIANLPLRGDSPVLAAIATELAAENQPITLRGLFYRIVSTGFFPSTDQKHYDKLGRLLTTLRRGGVIPYPWIVDNIRATIKPASWSGLEDFAETVRDAYRKHFWSELDIYPHVFIEKDAMSGVVEPVTRELDVPLSPVRGYTSDSYAYSIGTTWRRVDKLIQAIYIGDFDPSGFDLERSVKEKLAEFSSKTEGSGFVWQRIALNESDIDDFDLVTMRLKRRRGGGFSDTRAKAFHDKFGDRAVEVDAMPPNAIRDRVRREIMQWVPAERWQRLQEIEEIERETWEQTLGSLS